MIMKNNVPNYNNKFNKNQIMGLKDIRGFSVSEILCEKSMIELKEIYWFEKELLIAIPILISNATTFELVEMLTFHTNYLKEHIKKLERKFPSIGKISLKQSVA